MNLEFILNSARYLGYDGDGDGDGDGGDGGGKTYTEEEFNTHQAGLRRKYESQLEETRKAQKQLAAQLEKAKKFKGLSDEERTSLTKKIEDLESKYMTDQEKAERTAQEERQRHTQQIESLTTEAQNWRRQYETETVRNQISRAAETNKAHRASQIAAILNPMVEFKALQDDDGEPTGETVPVVRFPDVDSKTKKPIVMEYSIDEAVSRMTEMKEHQNLFDDEMKSGIGGKRNVRSGKSTDLAELAKNPAEYRRLRREKPELFT